jgi:hypothetical protein
VCTLAVCKYASILGGQVHAGDLPSRTEVPEDSPPLTTVEQAPAPQHGDRMLSRAANDGFERGRGTSENDAPEVLKDTSATRIEGKQKGRAPVSQQLPELPSTTAPSKLTVDKATGFRNITQSPKELHTKSSQGAVEKIAENLEPGREQLGKVTLGCADSLEPLNVEIKL